MPDTAIERHLVLDRSDHRPQADASITTSQVPDAVLDDAFRARYEVNPQLAIIECYVLDVIGELSPEEVAEAADAVEAVFSDNRDWRICIRDRLGWNALVEFAIAEKWCRYRRMSRESGRDPDPAEFARHFVDRALREPWN